MYIALKIHNKLKNYIENKELIGNVHSIFNKVINIKFNDKIYSLMAKDVFLSPYSILVNCKDFSDFKIKIGSIVILNNKFLKFDLEKIYLVEAIEYDLSIKNNLMVNEYILKNRSFLNDFINSKIIKNTEFEKNMSYYLNKVYYSLKEKRLEELENYSKKLIGFGLGLTPTGDDVLVGLYLVLSNYNFGDKVLRKFGEIFEKNKKFTTEISGQMLKNSIKGYYREPLIELINNIDKKYILIEDLKDILSIGYSSGFDLLRGISLGLNLICKNL